jgi:hypothetical protein
MDWMISKYYEVFFGTNSSVVAFSWIMVFALEIETVPRQSESGPRCPHCSSGTRLYGIEGHEIVNDCRVLTYVCPQCDSVHADLAMFRRAECVPVAWDAKTTAKREGYD